ncbi:MAG: MFS transporter, partial [Thermoprotei archaeon]
LITLLSFLTVFASTKEPQNIDKAPTTFSLAHAFAQTFRNPTFSRYITAYLFFQFGFYFFLSSLGYYVEDIVLPGNPDYKAFVGVFTLVAVIAAVGFSPLLVRYTDRKGEKKAFVLFTALLGVAMLLAFFVTPYRGFGNVYQMVLILVFAGLGLTSYFILPNAIISEIIDEDETITGYRREGIYFGVQGLLERVPSSLAGLVLGLWITNLFQPTHNTLFIRLLAVVGGVSILITALLFVFVPLKQDIKMGSRK